jgi:hypothetical protein
MTALVASVPTGGREPGRLYLLVRRDLSWSARSVQAAHAAVALALTRAEQLQVGGPCGPPIVLLGVEGESELGEWLRSLGDAAVAFREPDLGDSLTAVAYWGPAVPAFGTLRLL